MKRQKRSSSLLWLKISVWVKRRRFMFAFDPRVGGSWWERCYKTFFTLLKPSKHWIFCKNLNWTFGLSFSHNLASFSSIFVLFKLFWGVKAVDFSWIRTWIVGVEGKTVWPPRPQSISTKSSYQKVTDPRATAIAQWICLRLPSCRPRFESQAHHLVKYVLLKGGRTLPI